MVLIAQVPGHRLPLYEISQKISTENCHFYSREKSLYVAWTCLRNDSLHIMHLVTHSNNRANESNLEKYKNIDHKNHLRHILL